MECVCVKSVMSAFTCVCPLNATFEPPTVKASAEMVVAVNDAVPVTFKLVKEPVAAVTVPVLVMSVYVIPVNVVDRFVTSFMECVCPDKATELPPTVNEDATMADALTVPVKLPFVPLTAVPDRVDALTVPTNVAPVPLMVAALKVPVKLPFVLFIAVAVIPARTFVKPSMSVVACV